MGSRQMAESSTMRMDFMASSIARRRHGQDGRGTRKREGAQSNHGPPHPDPLPRVRGRGKKSGTRSIFFWGGWGSCGDLSDDVVLLAGGLRGGEIGAEADDDGGSFAGGGFDGDLAAVGGGDTFADGESEAGALDVVGADVAGVEGE